MSTEYIIGNVKHIACSECLPDREWIAENDGFIESDDSRERCEFCGEEPEAQPSEGDYVVSDGAYNDSREHVSQYGREIFTCFGSALAAMIRNHAERAQFWPNVFRVSDHGNISPILDVYSDADADPARIVYVGGIGWRYSDTLFSVAGFDQSAVDAKLNELEREERERAGDDWIADVCEDCEPTDSDCGCGDACDCDDPDLDDLVNYGISVFNLGDVIRDCLPSGRDGAEKLSELMEDGITIV